MSYRPRIPATEAYLAAIGRAAYNFSYLEWGIIWSGEDLTPGFLARSSSLPAGQIADCFSSIVGKLAPDHPAKDRLAASAPAFAQLVVTRNQLMPANPSTAAGGEQRLQYAGKKRKEGLAVRGHSGSGSGVRSARDRDARRVSQRAAGQEGGMTAPFIDGAT